MNQIIKPYGQFDQVRKKTHKIQTSSNNIHHSYSQIMIDNVDLIMFIYTEV